MGGRRTNPPTTISVSRLNAPHPFFVSQPCAATLTTERASRRVMRNI